MKLRLRGAVRADWEWEANRIPNVGDLFKVIPDWYRVTQVMWAIKLDSGAEGFDVGLVLTPAQPPNETEWVK